MSINLTEAEAFFALLRLATAAGSLPTAQEATGYWTSRLMSLKRFASMRVDEAHELIMRVSDLRAKHTREELLDAIANTLSPELRETAFVLATDVILADGILELKERDALGAIQTVFGLDDALVEKIVEVMLIKNRF